MINIAIRTEYSFKSAYGSINSAIQQAAGRGETALGIADEDNTFGHIRFYKACKEKGINPLLGVRLRVVNEYKTRWEGEHRWNIFIARNAQGLEELYGLVTKAWEQFYYWPKLLREQASNVSDNIIWIRPQLAISPFLYYTTRGSQVLISDNVMLDIDDKEVYELLTYPNARMKTYPQFLLTEAQIRYELSDISSLDINGAIQMTHTIADSCDIEIAKSDRIRYSGGKNIIDECMNGADKRGIDITQEPYYSRLNRELELIDQKGFTDYFMIVSEMTKYAKTKMLVGPSRGSSAGSLVCYLLYITEINPIEYGLIFERFVDINRHDLPDIDIDFPDIQRDEVFQYLIEKYGRQNVGNIGTVNTYQPKSAIDQFAYGLRVPKAEAESVKDAIIERSGGDARAAMCIADTFKTTDTGKSFISSYPKMLLTDRIEGHAKHAGRHAAGLIVSNDPIKRFCSYNARTDALMMDKKDAEYLDLLKIDCLGLKTLTVLHQAAEAVGMSNEDVYNISLDDEDTFQLFQDMRLSGVFQYEGYALQSITRQMGVHSFNDVVAITALARPGALHSGGANRYISYKTGAKTPTYFDAKHRAITEETYGIVIYQEQMMEIAREIGQMSWEDVSDLRRAASKSLGDEFFGKYKDKFLKGAKANGYSDIDADKIWVDIMSFGSWAFNKSHAVSYGLISYWTAWFKAHYPTEFAIAVLNNEKEPKSAIKFLRDMVQNEGMTYIPVDPDTSQIHWSGSGGNLLGGLTNIKGIGESKAKQILEIRKGKARMTIGLFNKLSNPETEFDILFPTQHYFGKYFVNFQEFGLQKPPYEIAEIQEKGTYIFIGRMVDRNLRDLNEYNVVAKRGGTLETHDIFYLNLTLEDDTDSIICTIGRYDFERLNGRHIAEHSKVDETWFMVKGSITDTWRRIKIKEIYELEIPK